VLAENGERIDAKAFLPRWRAISPTSRATARAAVQYFDADPVLQQGCLPQGEARPGEAAEDLVRNAQGDGSAVEAGIECVYTTVWPSWVQIENMANWHNQDFATRENGLAGWTRS
jgi:sn-glycerol 3-phosphate transport system substrate-binding protein